MKEVILNAQEIESVWEKDNLCFVRMKSGKVWLCELFTNKERTIKHIQESKGLLILPLSVKGGK